MIQRAATMRAIAEKANAVEEEQLFIRGAMEKMAQAKRDKTFLDNVRAECIQAIDEAAKTGETRALAYIPDDPNRSGGIINAVISEFIQAGYKASLSLTARDGEGNSAIEGQQYLCFAFKFDE